MKIYRYTFIPFRVHIIPNIIPKYPKLYYTTSLLVEKYFPISHIHNIKIVQSFICHTGYIY